MKHTPLAVLLAILLGSFAHAAPRALPEGQKPKDARLGKQRTLNSYFPMAEQAGPASWDLRRDMLRRRMLVSQGLWPLPEKTPLKTVVHGKRDMGDYTIEKVSFQSVPGHHVTGNLYRPKPGSNPKARNAEGELPGVLCPHGHWSNGRFYDLASRHGDNAKERFEKDKATGAEVKYDAWRSPLQARFVQLARMGCVVFHYDMIGYADSQQIAHRPGVRESLFADRDAKGQPKVGTWGFFSPTADLRLQTMMGLQTWNSIRALDFLLSLDGVDNKRIACTGGSGGGTQTFMLSALDARISVSVPAVMVSTAMQGGCTCEGSHHMRVGAGNIDFAAMFAPKPLCLIGANDWTKEIMTKGYPELQRHFKMLGAPGSVNAKAYLQYGHNYNYPSRQVMYAWLNKHFDLGFKEPIEERDFEFQDASKLTVWDVDHPKPAGGDEHERALLKWFAEQSDTAITKSTANYAPNNPIFRHVVGGAWDTMIGRRLSDYEADDAVEWKASHKVKHEKYLEFAGMLRYADKGEALPAAFFQPEGWNGTVVIWLDEQRGKSALFNADGSPADAIRPLLEKGCAIAGLDLLHTGEFTDSGQAVSEQPMVDNGKNAWQQYSGYTFGYNPSLFAQRVHDVLTMIHFVQHFQEDVMRVHVVAVNGAAPIAAAARAQSGNAIERLALDTEGFRFARLTSPDHPHFIPGAVKYGDLPVLITLSSPFETAVNGEGGEQVDLVKWLLR